MTAEQLFEDYFTIDDVAKLLGITVGRLRNKISEGKDHPPHTGGGKGIRFPKDEFRKWERARLVHQKNK